MLSATLGSSPPSAAFSASRKNLSVATEEALLGRNLGIAGPVGADSAEFTMASFFSPKSKHERRHNQGGRLGGLISIDTPPYSCDQYAKNTSKPSKMKKKKRPPPLHIRAGPGDLVLTTMSPASIILHDVDVEICSTPRTPRFFTLGGLSSTVNGFLSPCPSAPQLASEWQGNPASPLPNTSCFGPPLTAIELPGSILSPNYGFPPTTPTRTHSTPSLDDGSIGSPPSLTPSSGPSASNMSLFRTLTHRLPEPDDPIIKGKRVSQMNEFELWDVLQDLSEAQLKGTWATTIIRRVKERADLMDALRTEYQSQIAARNKIKANVTDEHLGALITLANSAEAITNRCNEVSHAVQAFLVADRNRVQGELDSMHEVHKIHFQTLKQRFSTQIEKLVKYIETLQPEIGEIESPIAQEITSIIFEHYEAKGATPPFEDALQDQHREVTLPAEEYLGMTHELQRLRKREKELDALLLEQQQVIEENKGELDLFKLDVKLYKDDEKEKEDELYALKGAFENLELEKSTHAHAFEKEVKELKAATQQAKMEASVTAEALSSAQQQLMNKDMTIENLRRNLRLLEGLNSPDTEGIGPMHQPSVSPAVSELGSTTDTNFAASLALDSGAHFPSRRPTDTKMDTESALYSHHNLSEVSTNSAKWMASSRPRTTSDSISHHHLSVSGQEMRERGTTARPLSPATATTPTSYSFRPCDLDLNKELPTPPSGALRADMVSRGSPMPRKTKEAAETPKEMKDKNIQTGLATRSPDNGSSDGSDGENRAQELANEFPELVRFKIQDLPELPDEMGQ